MLGADDPGPPPASGSMSRSPAHLNPSTDYFQHDPNSSLSSSPKIAPNDSPGTFFHDYSEHEASPASATFRPGTGRTYTSEPVEFDYNGDDRRPSVASATTVSSQGSKSSTGARFRKRLQGFFGDEYTGSGDFDGNSQKPAARPVRAAQRGSRERANSDGTRNLPARSHDQSFSQEEKGSDSVYPPREITPWLYQSINVSCSSFLSSARDGWQKLIVPYRIFRSLEKRQSENPQRAQTVIVLAVTMHENRREISPDGTLAATATREARKRSPPLPVTSLGTLHARQRDVTILPLGSAPLGKAVCITPILPR